MDNISPKRILFMISATGIVFPIGYLFGLIAAKIAFPVTFLILGIQNICSGLFSPPEKKLKKNASIALGVCSIIFAFAVVIPHYYL